MRLYLVQASRKRPEQSRTFGYLANSSQWLPVYKERRATKRPTSFAPPRVRLDRSKAQGRL